MRLSRPTGPQDAPARLHRALIGAARLLLEEHALYRKVNPELDTDGLGPILSERELKETEAGRECLKKKNEVWGYLESCAADPTLRPFMECWMIDFEGREGIPALADNISPEDISGKLFETAARADFGVLPKLVRKWLDDNNMEISDSGAGADGWELGVACDDAEAERICLLAYDGDLWPHIEAGELSVRLKFWGWHFQEVRTADDAKEFMARRSVS